MGNLYEKLDVISSFRNKPKLKWYYLLAELYFEDKRWIHANPTLYSRPGSYRYDDYYIINDAIKSRCSDLFEDVVDSEIKLIFLQGRRGSGKSSFLNYFINSKTRELNKKGITWVRIDCTKIYKNRVSLQRDLDFETYLYGQLLFSYFRYRGYEDKNGTIGTDFLCPDGTQDRLLDYDSVWHDIDLYGEITKMEDGDKRKKLVGEYESAQRKAKSARHCANGLEGKPFEAYSLGEKLYELCRDRLLLIIDGIDNVSYDSLIKDMVFEDLEKFLERIKQYSPHTLLLSMRNENKVYFENLIPFLKESNATAYSNKNGFYTVENANRSLISLSELVERFEVRLKQLGENTSSRCDEETILIDLFEYFKEFVHNYKHRLKPEQFTPLDDREDTHRPKWVKKQEEIEKFLRINFKDLSKEDKERWLSQDVFISEKDFFLYLRDNYPEILRATTQLLACRYQQETQKGQSHNSSLAERLDSQPITHLFVYMKHLEKAIAKAYKNVTNRELQPFDVVDKLFNGDLRELFVLGYKTYSLSVTLMKEESGRETTDFKTLMMSKYLKIMRFIFTNGNNHFISRNDVLFTPPYRNINFINLLNIANKQKSIISPVFGIYLLEYLRKPYDIETIRSFFKLNENEFQVLAQLLDHFLEFGYIYLQETDGKLHYQRTDKGEYILEYSIRDIVVMQSYLYGGLVDTVLKRYFETIEHSYKIGLRLEFVSKLQLNTVLLQYMLYVQETDLIVRGIQVEDIKVDFLNKRMRSDFLNYYKTNWHIYRNLDKVIGEETDQFTPPGLSRSRSFKHNLKAFVREFIGIADYHEHFKENVNNLQQLLQETEERFVFIRHFIGADSIEQIINSVDYHEFIFGDVSSRKKEERVRLLESIEKDESYVGYIYKIDKILEGVDLSK